MSPGLETIPCAMRGSRFHCMPIISTCGLRIYGGTQSSCDIKRLRGPPSLLRRSELPMSRMMTLPFYMHGKIPTPDRRTIGPLSSFHTLLSAIFSCNFTWATPRTPREFPQFCDAGAGVSQSMASSDIAPLPIF